MTDSPVRRRVCNWPRILPRARIFRHDCRAPATRIADNARPMPTCPDRSRSREIFFYNFAPIAGNIDLASRPNVNISPALSRFVHMIRSFLADSREITHRIIISENLNLVTKIAVTENG